VRVLRVVFQIVFLLVVLAILMYLFGNLRENARRVNLSLNFNFLAQPARVDIPDSPFRPSQPVRDALRVGFLNTVRVSALGISLALLLGIVIGVARLSTNWLVRKTAAAYVETLRNVPVLLWILFLYLGVVIKLPPISDPIETFGLLVLSNRGFVVPDGEGGTNAFAFGLVALTALVVALVVAAMRTRRFDATGQPHRRVLWATGTFLAILAIGYVSLGAPVTLSLPGRDGRVITGGIRLGPEYAALLIALVIYTASHIAEIVRGSIQAVPKGQSEAANAIALTNLQRLRFVVLPQAFRIAVPPLANQFLNLTKNSSLATAIGYVELTRLTQQAIANGSPAPPAYLVLMASYLSLSLTISLFANIVNRRLSLERKS
jgi:general L-amino acid transport system permease protein